MLVVGLWIPVEAGMAGVQRSQVCEKVRVCAGRRRGREGFAADAVLTRIPSPKSGRGLG